MERMYLLNLEIGGHRRDAEKEIMRGCMVEWGFTEDDFEYVPASRDRKRFMQASALSPVSEGEDMDDIVARIERAVWRSNGGMCHVQCEVFKIGKAGSEQALASDEETESLVA